MLNCIVEMVPPVASQGSRGVPGPAASTYLRVPPYVPVIAGEVGVATGTVAGRVAGTDVVFGGVVDGRPVFGGGVETGAEDEGENVDAGVDGLELQPAKIKARTSKVTTGIVNRFICSALPDNRFLLNFRTRFLYWKMTT